MIQSRPPRTSSSQPSSLSSLSFEFYFRRVLLSQPLQPFQKIPLDWKKHLQDSSFVSDALSFEKWDKNLEFETAK